MKPIVGNLRVKKKFGRWKRKVYIDLDTGAPKTLGIFSDLQGMTLYTLLKDAIDQAYDAGHKAGVDEAYRKPAPDFSREHNFRSDALNLGSVVNKLKTQTPPLTGTTVSELSQKVAEQFYIKESVAILSAMTTCANQGYHLAELGLVYYPATTEEKRAGKVNLTSRFSIKHKPTDKIIWPQ